jgi:cytochrome b561
VSTAVGERATASSVPAQFTALSRILHWLTAILVFSALFIGFVMVNSLGDYATLLMVHKTIGAAVLVVVVIRILNRITHRAPALPRTVGRFEKVLIAGSEVALYALLTVQPLVGWAMVSAGGKPIIVFGSVQLPPIAPVNLSLFSVLRETHSALAYLLVIIIAAHISAVLLHTIALGDGMLRRMTFRKTARPRAGNSQDGQGDQGDLPPAISTTPSRSSLK